MDIPIYYSILYNNNTIYNTPYCNMQAWYKNNDTNKNNNNKKQHSDKIHMKRNNICLSWNTHNINQYNILLYCGLQWITPF